MLGSVLDPASLALQQGGIRCSHNWYCSADAGPASLGVLYEQLVRQSLFLACMDCFYVIGWLNVLRSL